MSPTQAKRYDETARIMWPVCMALWFAYSLAHNLAGCSDAAKQDVKNFFSSVKTCEQKAVAGSLSVAEAALWNDVQSAIVGGVAFNSAEWKATGIALATKFGADTVACLASNIYQEIIAKKSVDAGVALAMRAIRPGIKLSYTTPDLEKYVNVIFEEAAHKLP